MYNPKDIQFNGKFDYDKEAALKFASFGGKSFSINIFPWVLKSSGKSMKPGKGVVRVHGSPEIKERVIAMAESIVIALDAGSALASKNVFVK